MISFFRTKYEILPFWFYAYFPMGRSALLTRQGIDRPRTRAAFLFGGAGLFVASPAGLTSPLASDGCFSGGRIAQRHPRAN
jgi:hypothetical protein